LVKMLATCFSTARSEITSVPAMAPFDLPSAIRGEDIVLSGGESVEVIGATGGP
jgi:hypothetical protein